MNRVVNPYTFVPFPDTEPKRMSPEETYGDPSRLLCGFLEVSLTNTTPLIIPESKPYEIEFEHPKYHFFRLPDKQKTVAIPGSELRGLVRSMYETVTNSCTAVLLDRNDFSMRSPTQGAFKDQGILEHDIVTGEWRLYTAVVHTIPLDHSSYEFDLLNETSASGSMRYLCKYRNGQMVRFASVGKRIILRDNGDLQETKTGWIMFNKPLRKPAEKIPSPNKSKVPRYYRICVLEKSPSPPLKIWTNDEPYRILNDILPDKPDRSKFHTNAHCDYRNNLKKIQKSGGCLPVWYLSVGRGNESIYYLSNAAIGRVHMNRTWEDVLGSFSPCKQYEKLCPACRLFGTAASEGFKSRVRFTDALCPGICEEDFGTITLNILGTPRPSAFEFYIRKPMGNNVRYWNYDYFGSEQYINGEKVLKYQDTNPAAPRGRKFYWHGNAQEKKEKPNRMNSTMQYLKPSHRFVFRVYYDGITEDQLNDLQYAMTLGDNIPNSDLQLKLGHAKPLGFGSVKLRIEKNVIRSCRLKNGKIIYSQDSKSVPDRIPEPSDATPSVINALKRVCSKRATDGKIVAYPKWETKNKGSQIYGWFVHNRSEEGGWKTLPEPTDPDITLEASPDTQSGASGSNNQSSYKMPMQNRAQPFSSSLPGRQGQPGMGRTNGAVTPVENSGFLRSGNSKVPTSAVGYRELIAGDTCSAEVTQIENKSVLLKIPKTNAPLDQNRMQACLLCRTGEEKRYKKGKKITVRLKQYNKEKGIWIVEMS